MATSMVELPKHVWTEVSTVSAYFQLTDNIDAYAIEASSAPSNSDTSIRKNISPGAIYTFVKNDGNLYIWPKEKTYVAIDPV